MLGRTRELKGFFMSYAVSSLARFEPFSLPLTLLAAPLFPLKNLQKSTTIADGSTSSRQKLVDTLYFIYIKNILKHERVKHKKTLQLLMSKNEYLVHRIVINLLGFRKILPNA